MKIVVFCMIKIKKLEECCTTVLFKYLYGINQLVLQARCKAQMWISVTPQFPILMEQITDFGFTLSLSFCFFLWVY